MPQHRGAIRFRPAERDGKRELWLRRYHRAAGKTVRVLDRNDSHRFWNGTTLRLFIYRRCNAEASTIA